jgi:hypothetical protein
MVEDFIEGDTAEPQPEPEPQPETETERTLAFAST